VVVEDDAVVGVEQRNDHRCGIDNRLDQRLLIPYLGLQAVEIGDVAMHAEMVQDLAAGIHHGRDAQFGKIPASVLAPIDQVPPPGFAMRDRLPKGAIEIARHAVVGDDRLVLAHGLLARVACDAGEGWIDVQDVALRIGDRDRHVGLIDRLLEDLWMDAGRQHLGHPRCAVGRCLELLAGHRAPPFRSVWPIPSTFRAAVDSAGLSRCIRGDLSGFRQCWRLPRAARRGSHETGKRHAGAHLATPARLWCAASQAVARFVRDDCQGACRQ